MIPGYLFLDIDGVLTSCRTFKAQNAGRLWLKLDPIAIEMIDRLCAEYNLTVVISSTWRLHVPRMDILLGAAGMKTKVHHKPTPQLLGRAEEIHAWLQENDKDCYKYIALDDTDVFDGDEWTQHKVITDPTEGFLYKHYLEAERILSTYK